MDELGGARQGGYEPSPRGVAVSHLGGDGGEQSAHLLVPVIPTSRDTAARGDDTGA